MSHDSDVPDVRPTIVPHVTTSCSLGQLSLSSAAATVKGDSAGTTVRKKKRAALSRRPFCKKCELRVPVQAAGPLRVVLLLLWNRQRQIGAVVAAAIMRTFGIYRICCAAVLTDQATHVPQAVPAAELPERHLTEQQVLAGSRSARIDERRESRR